MAVIKQPTTGLLREVPDADLKAWKEQGWVDPAKGEETVFKNTDPDTGLPVVHDTPKAKPSS